MFPGPSNPTSANAGLCHVESATRKVRDGVALETSVATEPEAIRCAVEGYADRLRRVARGELIVAVAASRARTARAEDGAARDAPRACGAQGATEQDRHKHGVRSAWYRDVYVKSEASYRLRLLLTHRRTLKRKFLDLENEIRHSFKVFGLKVSAVGRAGFEARVPELIGGGALLEALNEPVLRARAALWSEHTKLHALLVRTVSRDELVSASWRCRVSVGGGADLQDDGR
jgi:transposase